MLRTTTSASWTTSGYKEAVNSTGDWVSSGNNCGVASAGGDGDVGGKTTNLSKAKNLEKLSKSKKPDFANTKNSNGASGKDFYTPEARFACTRLRKTFTESPILHHYDPEPRIQIETDTSG